MSVCVYTGYSLGHLYPPRTQPLPFECPSLCLSSSPVGSVKCPYYMSSGALVTLCWIGVRTLLSIYDYSPFGLDVQTIMPMQGLTLYVVGFIVLSMYLDLCSTSQ